MLNDPHFWAIAGFMVMIASPWLDNYFMNRINFFWPAVIGFLVLVVSLIKLI